MFIIACEVMCKICASLIGSKNRKVGLRLFNGRKNVFFLAIEFGLH